MKDFMSPAHHRFFVKTKFAAFLFLSGRPHVFTLRLVCVEFVFGVWVPCVHVWVSCLVCVRGDFVFLAFSVVLVQCEIVRRNLGKLSMMRHFCPPAKGPRWALKASTQASDYEKHSET